MRKTNSLRLVRSEPPRQVPLIKPDLPDFSEIESSFRDILSSGKLSNFGKYVTQFELETGEFLGAQTITVSSGTLGLLLAMQALGLKPGQKVIVPSFTFMATVQAIRYAGGIPIFADIDDTLLLSIADVDSLLKKNPDTGLVVGVHTYGLPCHPGELEEMVKNHAKRLGREIPVLYDAAHAFGAAVGDRRVGSFGQVEVFSLSATKALVAVEGGLICTKDTALATRLKKMRNYGIDENYNARWPGMNGKMSEFNAVIGLANLKKIEWILKTRRELADYYEKAIRELTSFCLLPRPQNVTHTFKDFTVLLPEALRAKRQQVILSLSEYGIDTRAYFYPPVHKQDHFRAFATRRLAKTEELAEQVLTLPFFTTMTHEQIDFVVESLQNIEKRTL